MLKKRSLAAIIGVVAVGATLLSGCTSAAEAEPVSDEPRIEEVVAEPTASPEPSPTSDADATTSFLAWLEASRVPELDEACAPLAPELVAKMLSALQSNGFAEVSTCEEMMTVTAELYRALDQSAEVAVDVQSETASDAVLFVTYLAGGKCGTIVMERPAAEWIITEQSEECV